MLSQYEGPSVPKQILWDTGTEHSTPHKTGTVPGKPGWFGSITVHKLIKWHVTIYSVLANIFWSMIIRGVCNNYTKQLHMEGCETCVVNTVCILNIIKVEVQQSLYRPIQAQRVLGSSGSQILRHLVHEGGKSVSPMHWEIFQVVIAVRGWVDPKGHSVADKDYVNENIQWHHNYTIRDRTHQLPACSAVPEPNVLPCAHIHVVHNTYFQQHYFYNPLLQCNYCEFSWWLSWNYWEMSRKTM